MTPDIDYQPWGESLAELVDAAAEAEAAGVATVWVPELHRSSTVTASAVVAATSRVRVATGVALALVRSPLILALEALDLDEMSAGRLVLGLGPGVRTVTERWHGTSFDRPVRRMRETVAAVRAVFESAAEGTAPRFDGEIVRLDADGYRRPHPPQRSQVPIVLAAVGPQMLRLAGGIADGWLALEVCSPSYVREIAAPALAAGGRRPRIVASLCASVDDEAGRARDRLGPHLAFYASVARYRDLFAREGLLDEHLAIVAARRSGRPAQRVSDEMSSRLGYAGTAGGLPAAVGRYAGLADAVKLSPPVHLADPAEIRRGQRNLLRALAALEIPSRHPEVPCPI